MRTEVKACRNDARSAMRHASVLHAEVALQRKEQNTKMKQTNESMIRLVFLSVRAGQRQEKKLQNYLRKKDNFHLEDKSFNNFMK